MKRRWLSLLCVFCLLFTLFPTTVFAAEEWTAPTLKVSSSYNDGKVTTTVTLGAHEDLAALNFTLKYDSTKLKISGTPAGKDILSTSTIGTTISGQITPTWNDINGHSSELEKAILEVTFDVISGAFGDVAFTLERVSMTDKSGENELIAPGEGSVTTVSITIPKPPITSVTASVAAPVKGTALAATVDVGSAAAYTGTVEWYEGNAATGAVASGVAKANQVYTAKITLTPKEGESFADSITAPTGYTLGEHDTGKVVLTKTFPPTGDKDPLAGTVTITGTPKIGETLTADTTGITSTDLGTKTYKWYRGSDLISGANGSTYTPNSAADVGKKIKVEVSAANYSGSLMSAETSAVAKKDGPVAPAAPAVTKTSTTVTVSSPVTGNEYAISTTNSAPTSGWQSGTTVSFTGLNSNTDYYVFARVKETDTQEASAASTAATVKTDKATSTISITGNPSKTYDGNAVNDPAASKSGSAGTVTFTYYTDKDCNNKTTAANGASSNGAAPKNAGNYWVKATLSGDANHNSATSAAKAFTISKAAVTGIPGYTAIDASGKILEDVGLNPGTINMRGTLKWVDPLSNATPVEQGKSYKWRFTPDDENYAALEGTITPWPASGSGSITIIVPSTEEPAKPADQKNPTTGAVSDHIGYAAAGLAVVGALCVGAKKLAKKDED